MSEYFYPEASMYYKMGPGIANTIETIANAYIARNPPQPFVFRSVSRRGFRQMEDGRYDINLDRRLKNAKQGQYAFAAGMLWSASDRGAEYSLSCYGPTKIYLNGSLLYKSDVVEDVNVNVRKILNVPLKKGWNLFLLRMRKTLSGFGCIFGSARSAVNPMDFMSPFLERSGQAGWIYTESMDHEIYSENNMPDLKGMEWNTGIKWYPETGWDEDELKQRPCARIFGIQEGKYAYAWSKINSFARGVKRCTLKGDSAGGIKIWLNGNKVLSSASGGSFETEVTLSHGVHELLVESVSTRQDWGFSMDAFIDGIKCDFQPPYPVKGIDGPWLYLGPFDHSEVYKPEEVQTMYRLFSAKGESGKPDDMACTYWRVDRPGTWVRPYLDSCLHESSLYAKWSYPLGVTLYGLLRAGRKLERQDIVKYVLGHITECTSMYRYSLWDAGQYGYPSVNHRLVEMKMLDDCGSFGSAMLEAYNDSKEESFLDVALRIAGHMSNKQERREDGAFFRILKGNFMENTMWADDLYMSTPFLIRYYKLTGKQEYLEDAVRQFLLYQKYLYMQDVHLMSHVYDFKYDTITGIPWGRGNGWPLFSLSELLEVLPEDHKDRSGILGFFNDLCSGVLAQQGKNGLWHQVLTDHESYEETSCTAMFAYAFARGVRFGWLNNLEAYLEAVQKAWDGLTKISIDGCGNIYGVCRGSRYSFTPDYYKYELGWVSNDTHGIGIVMLAGIEIAKLDEWLKEMGYAVKS